MTKTARCAMAIWALWMSASAATRSGQPAPTPAVADDRIVLITLDGARTQEMFGGLDVDVLRSTLDKNQTLEKDKTYQRFWAPTAEERRRKLMPFFWGTLMSAHGSIAGNASLGSRVTLTNRHWFSYPGYAEILLGAAHDDAIKSNDPDRNPHPTVLEVIRERLALPRERVATFGSWAVFNEIVEHTEGATFVNAGIEPFDAADPRSTPCHARRRRPGRRGTRSDSTTTPRGSRSPTLPPPGPARSIWRSTRQTTGPTTDATTDCWTPTSERTATSRKSGSGSSSSRTIGNGRIS